MALIHSPKIPLEQLKLFLDAGNTKSYPGSGTTWSDLSGISAASTNSNVTFNSAGYMSYNGSTSYTALNSTNMILDNAQSTLSVWFRPTTNQGGVNSAVISDQFGPEYGIWYDGTNVRGYVYTSSQARAHSVGAWCNYTLTANAPAANSGLSCTLAGYYNGEKIGADVVTTVGNGLQDTPICLGTDLRSGVPTTPYTGDISIVMFYQRILSADEIKTIFNAHRGRYGL